MLNVSEILDTINMIGHSRLDIRTITMGVSLLHCAGGDVGGVTRGVYDTLARRAENLVRVGEEIEREFGIPIVNKRLSVTPVALITAGLPDPFPVARAMDDAAREVGVNFIGGYSALVHKAMTDADRRLLLSLPQALSETERVCASVNVASTKAGINMDAVKLMGQIILDSAERTSASDGIACAKLVVFANAVEDNPFMAGAFHGPGEGECAVNVGISGPGVIMEAISGMDGEPLDKIADEIKRTAFKITRMGQLVAQEASKRLGVPYGIVDLSLAPTPSMGDSVAHILEEMGLERVGTHGTTLALAMLNDAVKKGGVMASSHVGGLSGAFIPVSEDIGMIRAAGEGALTLDKLEAMTCVCSVGLDMIAVPGDTPAATLSAIIADEAAIGVINQKTTAVRIIPAPGKKAGEYVEFGGLLGRAPVIPVHSQSSDRLIARGGRVPAPVHSLRN